MGVTEPLALDCSYSGFLCEHVRVTDAYVCVYVCVTVCVRKIDLLLFFPVCTSSLPFISMSVFFL